MRNVVVYYRDVFDNYTEEHKTKVYPGDKAMIIKENLEMMGCRDFRVEPVREAA